MIAYYNSVYHVTLSHITLYVLLCFMYSLVRGGGGARGRGGGGGGTRGRPGAGAGGLAAGGGPSAQYLAHTIHIAHCIVTTVYTVHDI